jgi:hypothetical protein
MVAACQHAARLGSDLTQLANDIRKKKKIRARLTQRLPKPWLGCLGQCRRPHRDGYTVGGAGPADLIPAGKRAVAAPGAVAEQNVPRTVAKVVPDAHDGIGGVGAADLGPAGEGTITHRLEPDIARRVVPEQDVVGPVAEEVAHTDNRIMGIGAANLMPAGRCTVGDRLNPGVACRVAPQPLPSRNKKTWPEGAWFICSLKGD